MNESIQPHKKLAQVGYKYTTEEATENLNGTFTKAELAVSLNCLIARYNDALGQNQLLDNLKLSAIIKISNLLNVELKLQSR